MRVSPVRAAYIHGPRQARASRRGEPPRALRPRMSRDKYHTVLPHKGREIIDKSYKLSNLRQILKSRRIESNSFLQV